MTNGDGVPALSVIVVSFSGSSLLERCLTTLAQQTVRDGFEVVVVEAGGADRRGTADLPRRFPTMRWVSDPRAQTVPQLRTLGIARSRGEVVAFLEDDCLAPETWCHSLLHAHRAPCAAVGGAVEPGRFERALDWAMYFFEYARFMPPVRAGDADALPGTNVSYKRAALAGLAGERSEVPGGGEGFYEVFVHRALRRRGHHLRLDPTLAVRNVHAWAPWEVLISRFHHGRGFAAMRVASRPLGARLPFLGVALLLPFMQTARIMKEVVARRRYVLRAGLALPWIVLLAASWSLGEFVGYLAGPGTSLSRWR
jgi:glycosyltransferase involved in cell wall biosynthesis